MTRQVIYVDGEEERTQYGALWDSTLDSPLLWQYTIDLGYLDTIWKVRMYPRYRTLFEAMLSEFIKNDLMVNSIKCLA